MYTICGMKQLIPAILIALLFSGCSRFMNECGISTSLYNDCTEYYDSMGIYHKECPKNNIYNRCEQPRSSIKDCLNCN